MNSSISSISHISSISRISSSSFFLLPSYQDKKDKLGRSLINRFAVIKEGERGRKGAGNGERR